MRGIEKLVLHKNKTKTYFHFGSPLYTIVSTDIFVCIDCFVTKVQLRIISYSYTNEVIGKIFDIFYIHSWERCIYQTRRYYTKRCN